MTSPAARWSTRHRTIGRGAGRSRGARRGAAGRRPLPASTSRGFAWARGSSSVASCCCREAMPRPWRGGADETPGVPAAYSCPHPEDPALRTHLAALAAAVLLSWAGLAAADQWDRSFKVTGKPAIRIETDDGSVRVSAWDRPEVALHVATEGWRIAPGRVTVSARQAGERVELIARTPRLEWHLCGSHSPEITVRVPRQSDLEVHTGDGSIRIEPVAGEIRARSGDGAITASGLRGRIVLHTGDGPIEAVALDGELTATTGDGRIRVSGRFVGLDLGTGDGSLEAEVAAGSRMERPWSLHSGDGSMELLLPADFAADLDA